MISVTMRAETIPTEFEVLDERFADVKGDHRVERFDFGCRWAEGPVYVPAGRYLLVSDIPNDRILRWDETTGAIGVFRQPAGYANGNTLDREGRLVSCEHGNRRVTRTEHDGSITVLADRYDGKRLNSPNDVVVRSDGSIWFTDPAYGIDSDYEGHRAESEIGGCHVYRVDPRHRVLRHRRRRLRPTQRARLLARRVPAVHRRHRAPSTSASSTSRRQRSPAATSSPTCTNGTFDGLRLDDTGRVWAAAGDGVHCFDPDGTLIGKLLLPEVAANLVFGERKRNRLFVTATTSVYSLRFNVNGAVPVWATPRH